MQKSTTWTGFILEVALFEVCRSLNIIHVGKDLFLSIIVQVMRRQLQHFRMPSVSGAREQNGHYSSDMRDSCEFFI